MAKAQGYVVGRIDEGGGIHYLAKEYYWYEHERPEDAYVHSPESLEKVQEFIQASKWHGPRPNILFPAKWSSETGTVITGEPISTITGEPISWNLIFPNQGPQP